MADLIRLHAFDSRDTMVSALADQTLDVLAAVIDLFGEATWAVSGGSTPKVLFEEMRNRSFDWEKVAIALVDERWVDLDHARSNEAFMRGELERSETAKARFIGMKTADATPLDGQARVEATYRDLPFIGPCLLGLGPDGHTASLFPDAKGLAPALEKGGEDMVAAITAHKSDVTGDEVARMTLTAAAISGSRFPHLLITGAGKRDALEDAIAGANLPIYQVARTLTQPLDVYWAP